MVRLIEMPRRMPVKSVNVHKNDDGETPIPPKPAPPPIEIICVPMFPLGGKTMKLLLVDAVPTTVETSIHPEVAPSGTVKVRLVVEADVSETGRVFRVTLLALGAAPNPEPVTVTDVPITPEVGENELTVGKLAAAATRKGTTLAALPLGDITLIKPVVAPAGTCTDNFVGVAALTVALAPLNETIFDDGTTLNPVPTIETNVLPANPPDGVNPSTETFVGRSLAIDRILPAASYEYLAPSLPSVTPTSRPFGS